MPLPRPPLEGSIEDSIRGLYSWARSVLQALERQDDEQQQILRIDTKDDGAGTDVQVRIRVARAVGKVRVQVQSSGAGAGGAAYSVAAFVSQADQTTSSKTVDVTVPRNGVDRYYLFVAPIFVEPSSGTEVVYDGEGGRTDALAFAGLGV